MVELTQEEAAILAVHLEQYIVEEAQQCEDYEYISYLACLVNICDKCKASEEAPADDVRSVVLCKDCRHRDPEDHKCDCGQPERQGCIFSVRDKYWCACGEKREES